MLTKLMISLPGNISCLMEQPHFSVVLVLIMSVCILKLNAKGTPGLWGVHRILRSGERFLRHFISCLLYEIIQFFGPIKNQFRVNFVPRFAHCSAIFEGSLIIQVFYSSQCIDASIFHSYCNSFYAVCFEMTVRVIELSNLGPAPKYLFGN